MKTMRHVMLMGVVIVSLFIFVGVTAASEPLQGNKCGDSGPWGVPGGVIVKKNVFCEKERTWDWDILKTADYSELFLSEGQVHTVSYSVSVTSTPVDSNFYVSGEIYIQNQSAETVTINSVEDSQGEVFECAYGGRPIVIPFDLPSGGLIRCLYEGNPLTEAASNVATVSYGDGESQAAVADIDWSQATTTLTDECVNVNDTLVGPLGFVCAPGATFTYVYNVGPYEVCGDYLFKNQASYLTEDTLTTGASSWFIDVKVPCDGGCSLTPGYWKTHSIFGPAPYDDTWAMIGESTPFFLSGQSYYDVLWTSPKGNAYYILGHAFIAAELNELNGADFTDAQDAFDAATALFETYSPDQVAGFKGSAKGTWITLATILDDYNNGLIGPGHCTE